MAAAEEAIVANPGKAKKVAKAVKALDEPGWTCQNVKKKHVKCLFIVVMHLATPS